MYTFIVLGLVPGTNIQITFQMWLGIVGSLLAFIICSTIVVHVYRLYSFTIDDVRVPVRMNLYANQLHYRG